MNIDNAPLVVIKYGGHAMSSPELNQAFAKNIYAAKNNGWQILIGHGGGPQINALLEKLEIKSTFKDGLRVTCPETMQVVEMVLTGQVNPWLVSLFCEHNLEAVGLSGKDCKTLMAKEIGEGFGLVGEVVKVNPKLCQELLDKNYLPVVAPIGYGQNGTSLNINADIATGALAGALRADIFILVTDVPGVLDQNKNRINHLTKTKIDELIADKTIYGGMLPKLESCLSALSNGCRAAFIFDGQQAAHLAELLPALKQGLDSGDFSSLSSGTVITD